MAPLVSAEKRVLAAIVMLSKSVGGEPVIEAEVLGQEADASAYCACTHWLAEQQGLSAARPHETQQHLDGSALAGSARAKEAESLAATYAQDEVPYHKTLAVVLSKSRSFDRQICHS